MQRSEPGSIAGLSFLLHNREKIKHLGLLLFVLLELFVTSLDHLIIWRVCGLWCIPWWLMRMMMVMIIRMIFQPSEIVQVTSPILTSVMMMMLAKPNLVILDGGVQYLLRWQLLEVDDTQKPLLVILQTSYSSWQFLIRQKSDIFHWGEKNSSAASLGLIIKGPTHTFLQFHPQFESTF